MAGKVPNQLRNDAVALFREQILEKMGVVLFPHQREWWLASEGKILLPEESPDGVLVRTEDDRVIRRATAPRPGGHARFLADLGAFKSGKSFGAGLWAAGFGIVPGARVSIIGLEYDTCSPEFEYIVEALLSSRGMGLKAASMQNQPRQGKMWLDLEDSGARFEARSWERQESLKGKEIDAYIYAEAYQLPGIECFTSFKQNLNARRGFAAFATTPDRPWIKLLHELGHSNDPDWFCVCGVPQSVNPYTFDAKALETDKALMTTEKYQIHYYGMIGDFVGHVFSYQRGQKTFNPTTHPELYDNGRLRVPEGWEVVCGADTGTYYTGLVVAFSPDGRAFVLDELPNYRYVGGSPEREESITIPQWAREAHRRLDAWGARPNFWADKNTQFKKELENYGIFLFPSKFPGETRTEITREYFEHNKIWLAPHLEVLPFELENAAYPEEASLSGKFGRVKDRDHTLDCLEHILSQRPRGKVLTVAKSHKTWLETYHPGGKASSYIPMGD